MAGKSPKGDGLLPAPIEEVNNAIAATWEQLGIFKKLQVSKAAILDLCNMGDMPMTGIDIIPTSQGPKLYINHDGAKYNREKYLRGQGRTVANRKVEIVDPSEVTFGIPEQHKNQNRIVFRILTKVRDESAHRKVVDAIAQAVAAGHTDAAEKGIKLLEALESTYQTFSAFSYQSEKFPANKTPDHILKKGITQACRRADLEISMQVVIPSDEEPVDAEFTVKAGEKLKEAKKGATLPGATLTPGKVAPGPADEGGTEKGEKAGDMKKLGAELSGILAKAGMKRGAMIKWMTENMGTAKPSEMTPEILQKAVEKAKADLVEKKPEEKKPAPAKEKAKEKSDPDRTKIMKKIFARREEAGFESDDDLRKCVKATCGKGLSEMDSKGLEAVSKSLHTLGLLSQHKRWGFDTPEELAEYVKDALGKPLSEVGQEELQTLRSNLEEMI